MEKKSRVVFALALAVMAVLALSSAVVAGEETPAKTDADSAETLTPVSVAGMTVFIDKETGQLRPPTAEEAAELSAAMQRMFGPAALAPEAFAPVQRADGSVVLELGLSQLDFSVATIGADGDLEFSCLDSAHAANDHVHNQVQPTAEEK